MRAVGSSTRKSAVLLPSPLLLLGSCCFAYFFAFWSANSQQVKIDSSLKEAGFEYNQKIYDAEVNLEGADHLNPLELIVGNMVFYHKDQLKKGGKIPKWPKGSGLFEGDYVIPYSETVDEGVNFKLQWVIAYIKKVSNVRFVAKQSPDEVDPKIKALKVYNGDGCYATVGYPPSDKGKVADPVLSVTPALNCATRRAILHLAANVMGFVNNVNRADRDHHVKLYLSNSYMPEAFQLIPASSTKIPYDFSSVLQLTPYYSSKKDAGPTFVPKDLKNAPLMNYQIPLFSSCDLLALSTLYPGRHITVDECTPNQPIAGFYPTPYCIENKGTQECEKLCSTVGGHYLEHGLCQLKDGNYLPELPPQVKVHEA